MATRKILWIVFIALFLVLTVGCTKTYKIGDTCPAGGTVFYDKGVYADGWRYLSAAPAGTEFNAEWGAYIGSWATGDYVGIDVSGTSTAIGSGKANTNLIVDTQAKLGEAGRAAQLCRALKIGGFDDWFLPSGDELALMYQNLHEQGLGDFGKGNNSESWMNWMYWSSSQDDSAHGVLSQDLYDGLQVYNIKDGTYRVRACRAF